MIMHTAQFILAGETKLMYGGITVGNLYLGICFSNCATNEGIFVAENFVYHSNSPYTMYILHESMVHVDPNIQIIILLKTSE